MKRFITVALMLLTLSSPVLAGSWSLDSKSGSGQVSSSVPILNYSWTTSPQTWYAYSWGTTGSDAWISSSGTFELKFKWSGTSGPSKIFWSVYVTTTESASCNTGNSLTLVDGNTTIANSNGETSLTQNKSHEILAMLVSNGGTYYLTFDGPYQMGNFQQSVSGFWNGQAGCGISVTSGPF